ncbi:MAG: TraY domain-containing protein [Rhodospirillaceae bacterium]|nr:TraY domain-containing protein [Rhodospirillaceae bacterium]
MPKPADIEERLEHLAMATGRTKTFYARETILQHLEDLEDVYLAEQTLTELRAGRERTYPLEEVIRDLGLED